MSLALGLDAGGTATRWVLEDAGGAVVARGEGPPISGLVFTEEATRMARAAAGEVAVSVLRHGRPDTALAGVTGTSDGSRQNDQLRAILAEAFAVAPARVRVHDDLWLAHRARFAPGTGILVYCGTGSAAVHVRADRHMVRTGGHGYLIDDAGSGFAIARDGLRAILRAEDEAPGSGWDTALGRALAHAVGGPGWDRVRAYVYGGTRGTTAALALAVAQAAHLADATAAEVLCSAGRELARLARLLALRIGPQPIALAGRGARLHPFIHQTMQTALQVEVGTAAIDQAAAAARIAAREF